MNPIENTTEHADISEALAALERAMKSFPSERHAVFTAAGKHLLVHGESPALPPTATRVASYLPPR